MRLTDGRLAVWCEGSRTVEYAPVPPHPGPFRAPGDRRPGVGPGTVQPARVTMALNLYELEGPEVDEALGVLADDGTDSVVDAWEAGTATLQAIDVRRLATLTGMTPAWLCNPDPVPGDRPFLCGRGDQ